MAKTKVVLNRRGMREVLTRPEMVDALMGVADEALARAENRAPVESGEYKDGLGTESGVGPTRAYARVVASAEHSQAVEAKYRVLGGSL